MSLEPQPIGPIPELTALVAGAAFPDGDPLVSLRDARGSFDDDERFADRGRPAETPWLIALVTVLQCEWMGTPTARPSMRSAAASTGSAH